MQKQAADMQVRQRHKVIGELKQEWGADFQDRANDAARAARAVGVDIENSPLADHPDFIRAMANVAQLLKEDTRFVTGHAPALSAGLEGRMSAIRNSAAYQGKEGPEKQQQALQQLRSLHGARR